MYDPVCVWPAIYRRDGRYNPLHFQLSDTNNDIPLLFLCCSSTVPLFENTGAGSLDQILVAQVGSGDEPGGVRDQETPRAGARRRSQDNVTASESNTVLCVCAREEMTAVTKKQPR